MKLMFGVMYFHRHNNGGGGIGRLRPMIENKHIPHRYMSLDLENKYIDYYRMDFHRIWPPASGRKRSSRMKSY